MKYVHTCPHSWHPVGERGPSTLNVRLLKAYFTEEIGMTSADDVIRDMWNWAWRLGLRELGHFKAEGVKMSIERCCCVAL